ncbi:MAG: hypothetical protein FD165_206 [Gammaproteobacteria bacterium]|nr:MAG: hypothetical protein FD165_206 [Gammaproteobacteria bacterium]TND06784.1 MAG: hypothetical protein FD120_516 [Gammaproteobacteria bacterium]
MNIDFSYARLTISWKILISGFLIVLGSGYLAGAANAILAVGITPAAIADHYGDKRLSKADAAAIGQQGFVEEEFSLDDAPDTASDEMAHDMDHDMDHEMTSGDNAAMTHDMAGMDHATHGDDTLPAQVLAQVSHVHWLGFSLLLLATGTLACLTRLAEFSKALLVSLLFLAFFSDIASLNLVRFVSPDFSWLTVVAGTTVGLCLAVISLRVLWELWGPSRAH